MFRRISLIGSLVVFFSTAIQTIRAQSLPEDKHHWQLALQTFTFNQLTFFEAVKHAKQGGLTYVEAYQGQALGDNIPGKFDYRMDVGTQKQVLALLQEEGIHINAFGVVSGNTEEEWYSLFEFADAMGIQTLNSEPRERFLPLVGRLATKYKIRVGIHNHAKPTPYWDPHVVVEAIEKAKSPYVGACADIGHWVRSGLDPVAALKTYEGRLVSLHLKDLSERSKDGVDVFWGSGTCNIRSVIDELMRQEFQGNISVEIAQSLNGRGVNVQNSVTFFRNYVGNINGLAGAQSEYLHSIKASLQAKFPNNRTVNIVFHGHSVPAGYWIDQGVHTMESYPNLFLSKLKGQYPYAVVNVIVTAIGGEHSVKGNARFETDVLCHKPDVVVIDYALNDIGLNLADSKTAWESMIEKCIDNDIKVILVTPSPDQRIDLLEKGNKLEVLALQIAALAATHHVALADCFATFRRLAESEGSIVPYMAGVNHPNRQGHEIIAEQLKRLFL